ncbi:FAD:protein FMN transferase [Roseibacillus ishigakijimensis]
MIPRDLDPGFLAARAGDPGSLSVLEGETMGTYWKLHFLRPPGCARRQVLQWVEADFALVVRQMSHYAADSELTLFNQAPAGEWRPLSPEFFHVLREALAFAAETEGRYDPSVGQLVRRCGFGPDLFLAERETSSPGWSAIELDETGQRARHQGACCLDLSSIAKGYALDRVGGHLEREGIFNYLLEVGGEFRGSGIKPGGLPWWVDLDPLSGGPSGLPPTRVALCGLSLATSGTAVQSRKEGGKRQHHLIDPLRGESAHSSLRAVSVLAPTCLAADAWATALFVLGPEEGLAKARERALAATFVACEGEGYREFASPAFEDLLTD